jgi:hypothetical protein
MNEIRREDHFTDRQADWKGWGILYSVFCILSPGGVAL